MALLTFGFILLVFGIVLQRFPPDYYTQRFYGYRTTKSQRDETSWIKGNKLAAKYLVVSACCNLFISLVLMRMRALSATAFEVISSCLIGLTVFLIYFFVEKQL
jgi:uncharacterized membrane protein